MSKEQAEQTSAAEEVKQAPVEESESLSDKQPETEPKETSKSNVVPYQRFKEVNDTKKELEGRLQALESELNQRSEAVNKLTDLLEAKEEDSNVLNQIRALATDPKNHELLQQLDNKLKGVDEDVEEGTKSPKEGADEYRRLLDQTREELQESVTDVRHDQILTAARSLAERYLDSLPEEYTDSDRKIIGHLLTDNVNWEAVDENPDTLSESIASALQETLDFYGEPRGKFAQAEETEEKTEAPAPKTPADKIGEILDKEWGALKEVKTPSGTRLQPQHSEEELSKAMADILRIGQQE